MVRLYSDSRCVFRISEVEPGDSKPAKLASSRYGPYSARCKFEVLSSTRRRSRRRRARPALYPFGRINNEPWVWILADAASELTQVMRRGVDFHSKLRSMREVVGVVNTAIESAERAVEQQDQKSSAD